MARFTFQGREYDVLDVDEMTLRESFELRRVVGGSEASEKEFLAGICWLSVRAARPKTTWEFFLDHTTNADLDRMITEITADDDDAASDDSDDSEDGDDADPPLRAVSGESGSRGSSASTTSPRGGSRTSRRAS